MNEPRDDLSDLQQIYRSLPDEPVPSEMDERVLAMAQTTIESKRRSRWLRWSAPVALAASVLVVVAIVLDPTARETAQVVRSHGVVGQASTQAPAAESSEPRETDSAPVYLDMAEPPPAAILEQAEPRVQAKAKESARAMREAQAAEKRREESAARALAARRQAHDEVRADPPAPAAENETPHVSGFIAKSESEEKVAAKLERPAQPVASVARPVAPPPAAVASVADADPELAEIAVTGAHTGNAGSERLREWLYRIHELQVEGKKREAALQIEALQRQYPWLDVKEELRKIREAEQQEP